MTGPVADIWCCPRCHSGLASSSVSLTCRGCGGVYPIVGGIPDLRVDAPAWVDAEADRQRAESLLAVPNVRSGIELACLHQRVMLGRRIDICADTSNGAFAGCEPRHTEVSNLDHLPVAC